MFKLMNWRILLAAGFSVWIGFSCGYILSTSIRLPMKDRIAISIETGIQNTGTAIVLLGFSLPDPDNDISAVVPVAASIMTPIPLTIVWIAIKCYDRFHKPDNVSKASDSPTDRRTLASSTATLLPSPSNSTQINVQGREEGKNPDLSDYSAIWSIRLWKYLKWRFMFLKVTFGTFNPKSYVLVTKSEKEIKSKNFWKKLRKFWKILGKNWENSGQFLLKINNLFEWRKWFKKWKEVQIYFMIFRKNCPSVRMFDCCASQHVKC